MHLGTRKIEGKNPFERQWGISANELAEQEGVSPEAIHMRVRNFGTPWQRRKRPNLFEKVYGKTIPELCRELNLHPTTLQGRYYTYGCVYAEPPTHRKIRNGFCEEILKKYDERSWLMPQHPDYEAFYAERPQHEIKKRS